MVGTRLDPGDRAVRWINNLTLSDDFAGKPFTLRPWQAEIPRKLFGTFRPDGRRQYRRAFFFIPRKQAKTQLAAAIGVFCLLGDRDADGRPKEGQEIDCAASDTAQASHSFKKAVDMIDADSTLRNKVKVYHSLKKIEAKKTGNILKVLSSEGRRQHGLNPSTILFDELHTQPNRELYDALTSAQATRLEPLVLLISTAGNDRESLCHAEWKRACQVRDGLIEDPEYLAVIYQAEADDDWHDEAVWHRAMPALGDFAQLDFIRGEYKKACESRSEESKFRQLYLNQWVASEQKWLDREKWDACAGFEVDREALKGGECFGGLDLSNKSDITAFVLAFPVGDDLKALCWFWIPEDYARERDRKGYSHYLQWADEGFITLTPGDMIDYRVIEDTIIALCDEFDVRHINIDPYNASQTGPKLAAVGLPVEYMRQGTFSMNDPTKHLEVLISRGQLHHGNNPVLNWMADNAVSEMDSQGNVKLCKGKSADKIDGMISLIMGVRGAMDAHDAIPSLTVLKRGPQ